jgi:IclR family mhp operon transcriptional activator
VRDRRAAAEVTASGKAYFASCDDAERGRLLDLLVNLGNEQSAIARNRRLVRQIVSRIRADGYATYDGEWIQETKTVSIALPIRDESGVLGCLNAVYLRRAMPIDAAVRRFLPPLREAVAKIEEKLAGSLTARSTRGVCCPRVPPRRRPPVSAASRSRSPAFPRLAASWQ